jgi:hypothetical protein
VRRSHDQIKTTIRRSSPNHPISSLKKDSHKIQKFIEFPYLSNHYIMNEESPPKDQSLAAAEPTNNMHPPSQKKRNHEDVSTPIPPSPPKLKKTTSSESNSKEKKGVTPTAKIAKEDPFKPFNAIRPVNLMSAAGPRLYIKTVAHGLFHLIYVQELNGTEAFSHPVIKKLFPNPNERTGKNTDFVQSTGIIAAAPRRTSKALNIPTFRTTNDHKVFKATVYVSILDNSAPTCKHDALNTMTDVSTERRKQKMYSTRFQENVLSHHSITCITIHEHPHTQLLNHSNSTNKMYQVPFDFDKTEPLRQCLDEYLMDDSIIRILEHVLRLKPKNDFYNKYPSVAHSLFSEPYPIMAHQILGYPAPDLLPDNDGDIEYLGTSTPGDASSNNNILSAAVES